MWRARRRCRASSATARSIFALYPRPRASSAPRCWPPAITSPRGRCRGAAARSTARATKSAARAISCLPHRRGSAPRPLRGGSRALYRARDEERDQSYFLFATTREQLGVLRFPLGDKTKAEPRELARRFGLSGAGKHDSQDSRFV